MLLNLRCKRSVIFIVSMQINSLLSSIQNVLIKKCHLIFLHWIKCESKAPFSVFASRKLLLEIQFCQHENLSSFVHKQKCMKSAILARFPPTQPFQGVQMSEQAHLARGACLGSCPCLRGQPELMVLKWRADGDRGLIAVEGASESHPRLQC